MFSQSRRSSSDGTPWRLLAGALLALLACPLSPRAVPVAAVEPLAGTEPLAIEGDITLQLVEGVDRFLLRELDKSVARRAAHWKRELTSAEAHDRSIEPNRRRLAHVLGVRDTRIPFDEPELVVTATQPSLAGTGDGYQIYAVRWPTIRDLYGEGLLLVPTGKPVADIVAIPDADQTPEMLVGLVDGVALESQFARRLAESGCRVLIPTLIDREFKPRNARATLTSREYLYRSAYELGRHLIGYELQQVLAGVDWFSTENAADDKIGVIGYGEGGMLALYAGALDTRIDAVGVSGFFSSRQNLWQEPIDRNVFGLLEQFGAAELAAMSYPRTVLIEAAKSPEVTLASQGGAPAQLVTPALADVKAEVERAVELVAKAKEGTRLIESGGGTGPFGTPAFLSAFLSATAHVETLAPAGALPANARAGADPAARQRRLQHRIDDHNQWLLRESPYVRRDFMNIELVGNDKSDGSNKLDASSPEAYAGSVERFRDFFRKEVVGHFDEPLLTPKPRSRKTYDNEKWTGYEVVLDVFPDVIAYGILCVPKNIQDGEKRPVVVCQHGLEGRPQDVVAGNHDAYHDFASKLAERGFITFAPQNLYIGHDKFRTLQRKAYLLKKTLFSVIAPQHQQIVNWLKTLPQVDEKRIAFYGLSYGGKSAMRIPPLVTDYCLSICSADFNEWVWKNASTRSNYSYVWTGEYEIFEWDLGSTFNYAEMAALIAPRPFMVERGHFDGVAPDETVGYEFAKVRHLYAARLGMADRCEIEWFVGPHTINGQATYAFLHKHLNWPQPAQ